MPATKMIGPSPLTQHFTSSRRGRPCIPLLFHFKATCKGSTSRQLFQPMSGCDATLQVLQNKSAQSTIAAIALFRLPHIMALHVQPSNLHENPSDPCARVPRPKHATQKRERASEEKPQQFNMSRRPARTTNCVLCFCSSLEPPVYTRPKQAHLLS